MDVDVLLVAELISWKGGDCRRDDQSRSFVGYQSADGPFLVGRRSAVMCRPWGDPWGPVARSRSPVISPFRPHGPRGYVLSTPSANCSRSPLPPELRDLA
jgi:hypothetical protein